MNALKKILGIVWIVAGMVLAAYLPYQAVTKLTASTSSAEDVVFWVVVIIIFIPISIGFVLFGYYATKGEYGDAS